MSSERGSFRRFGSLLSFGSDSEDANASGKGAFSPRPSPLKAVAAALGALDPATLPRKDADDSEAADKGAQDTNDLIAQLAFLDGGMFPPVPPVTEDEPSSSTETGGGTEKADNKSRDRSVLVSGEVDGGSSSAATDQGMVADAGKEGVDHIAADVKKADATLKSTNAPAEFLDSFHSTEDDDNETDESFLLLPPATPGGEAQEGAEAEENAQEEEALAEDEAVAEGVTAAEKVSEDDPSSVTEELPKPTAQRTPAAEECFQQASEVVTRYMEIENGGDAVDGSNDVPASSSSQSSEELVSDPSAVDVTSAVENGGTLEYEMSDSVWDKTKEVAVGARQVSADNVAKSSDPTNMERSTTLNDTPTGAAPSDTGPIAEEDRSLFPAATATVSRGLDLGSVSNGGTAAVEEKVFSKRKTKEQLVIFKEAHSPPELTSYHSLILMAICILLQFFSGFVYEWTSTTKLTGALLHFTWFVVLFGVFFLAVSADTARLKR